MKNIHTDIYRDKNLSLMKGRKGRGRKERKAEPENPRKETTEAGVLKS